MVALGPREPLQEGLLLTHAGARAIWSPGFLSLQGLPSLPQVPPWATGWLGGRQPHLTPWAAQGRRPGWCGLQGRGRRGAQEEGAVPGGLGAQGLPGRGWRDGGTGLTFLSRLPGLLCWALMRAGAACQELPLGRAGSDLEADAGSGGRGRGGPACHTLGLEPGHGRPYLGGSGWG